MRLIIIILLVFMAAQLTDAINELRAIHHLLDTQLAVMTRAK